MRDWAESSQPSSPADDNAGSADASVSVQEGATALAGGPEFDVVRRLLGRWGGMARAIGDDAAVMRVDQGGSLVVSTDTSVENVHFRREWLTPQEIGYRSAAAALSDIAAMGASPVGMLLALTLPQRWRSAVDEIADGVGEAAGICDMPIVGGDLSDGAQLSLTFTVLGSGRRFLRRSGALAGDGIYVTGEFGGPGAALQAFARGARPEARARERFARPAPRIKEAIWLARNGASAGIDVSDGLSSDLCHIAAASARRLRIDLELLPILSGVDPQDAVASGEEYELAVTIPDSVALDAFAAEFSIPLTRIGEVVAGEPGVEMLYEGKRMPVPRGYMHFVP